MDTPRHWIGYDTFKLIVAILLLLLLLFLVLRSPALPPTGAAGQANLSAVATATQAIAAPATAIPLPIVANTAPPTTIPTPSATVAPTNPPTEAPTTAPTNTPENATPTPEAAPIASPTVACNPPAPSRLATGKNARTLGDLNLRSEPKIDNNILTVNPTGTTLKVLQGPVCVPYQGSAYLWWQVETSAGKTGWSAENYINGQGYYLKPLP